MKNLHHTFLLILAISVTLVVAAIYGYMRHTVNASAERAVLAHDIVRIQEADKAHEQDIVTSYEKSADSRARLTGFFVPADKVVSFIEAIEAFEPASGGNVSISSLDADNLERAAPGTIGSVDLHVDADGSWPSVMRVLMLAENLPYAVSVGRIRLDAADSSGSAAAKRGWKISFDIGASLMASATSSPQ